MRSTRIKVAGLLGYTFLVLVLCLPAGSRLGNRDIWNSQHNQDEFNAWAAGLGTVGLDLSGREFQDLLWRVTKRYLQARNTALAPLNWLSYQLGFVQSWRMFSNPQTAPSRLWVELDSGNGFTPLYVVGSDTHAWKREFFEHHRIRKLLGRLGRAGRGADYKALGNWLARRAAREFPDATHLRLRVYTWRTEPPGTRHAAKSPLEFARYRGTFARSQTFDLGKLRR